MKRIALYFGIAAALVASCSIQEEDIKAPQQDDVIYYASFEQPAEEETRVYANEDLLLRWTADDRVSIFGKNTYNQQYRFLGETGDNSGGFSKVDVAEYVTGNPISHTVSVYPYQSSTKITEDEVVTLTLPAEQHYAENTFGLGDNTMISVSADNILQYKNVGGYLMLKLYGEGVSVSSITLKGNNGEKLAGKAAVTMPLDGMPSVSMADDSSTEITLVCDTPVSLGSTAEESTEFWFVVPPVAFSKGVTISINQAGGSIEKTTSKSIPIERNRLSKMSAMEVEWLRPNNVICYTSTNGKIVTPYRNNFGDANIVSNEYIDGRGRLTFDRDLTQIGIMAFYFCQSLETIEIPSTVKQICVHSFCTCSRLTSIEIPSSVTSIEIWAFENCRSLSSIRVAPGNLVFDSRNDCNAIIRTEDNTLVIGCGSTTIPDSVTSIQSEAFEGNGVLSSIDIPNSIISIGHHAFYGCSSLSSIEIPGSVTEIGHHAFAGCPSVSSIKVAPNNLNYDSRNDCNAIIETSSNSLVVGCKNTVIPDSVTSIGVAAFCQSGVSSITIPNSVTSIGESAFFNCLDLTSLVIPSSVTSIGDQAFLYSSLRFITFRAKTPPIIGIDVGFPSIIYVPAESVDAYKSAQYWSDYADRIQAIPSSSPSVPVPEAVDLGLPSGVKWASFNLGASKPEEYGDFFAWGETEPYYSSLDPLTWKEGKEAGYNWASYKWCMSSYNTLTKYCNNSSYGYNGFTDGKTALDPEDDAAYVNLGGSWRMPTDEEWTEVRENCTWTWTTQNGVNGRLVTGGNGNSIFIPAAGGWNDTSLRNVGSIDYSWSSSYVGAPRDAWYVCFNSGSVDWSVGYRYYGFTVRPVCD